MKCPMCKKEFKEEEGEWAWIWVKKGEKLIRENTFMCYDCFEKAEKENEVDVCSQCGTTHEDTFGHCPEASVEEGEFK